MKNKLLLFLIPFLILFAIYFNKPNKKKSETRFLLDSVISITVYDAGNKLDGLLEAGFRQFEIIEETASYHKAGSELDKLNKERRIKPSETLSELLEQSIKAYEITNNYFDVSFAPLHEVYGFYSKKPYLPTENELAKTLAKTGLSKILTQENSEYKLHNEGMIDFGGIAGGYAVDKAAQTLKKMGCNAFLIDNGGDIWIEGIKPNESPWRVAVRDPDSGNHLAIIETTSSLAIATSGGYERFIQVGDKKYSHILNPLTGVPVDYYSSVTVIASSTLEADIFATAAFAMPPEVAYKWVEDNKISALFLTASNEKHISTDGKKWFK